MLDVYIASYCIKLNAYLGSVGPLELMACTNICVIERRKGRVHSFALLQLISRLHVCIRPSIHQLLPKSGGKNRYCWTILSKILLFTILEKVSRMKRK
jgi:hypothetical protein